MSPRAREPSHTHTQGLTCADPLSSIRTCDPLSSIRTCDPLSSIRTHNLHLPAFSQGPHSAHKPHMHGMSAQPLACDTTDPWHNRRNQGAGSHLLHSSALCGAPSKNTAEKLCGRSLRLAAAIRPVASHTHQLRGSVGRWAVSDGEIAISCGEIATSGGEIAISIREIAISGGEISISDGKIMISGDDASVRSREARL